MTIKADPAYAARVATEAKRLQREWAADYAPCGATDPLHPGMGCRLPAGHRAPEHWASPDSIWTD